MRTLLDTHFVLWITSRSRRLTAYPWIGRYRPWGVSPVSILEVAYLSEAGRIDADQAFGDRLLDDPRFEVDDVPSLALMRRAVRTTWTRDPFDRLLTAHSSVRRVPLCTVDSSVLDHHELIVQELES